MNRLSADSVDIGDPLEMVAFGGPANSPALQIVSSVDGTPLFLPFAWTPLDAAGVWTLNVVIPPWVDLSGVQVGFRVLAIGAEGGIVQTNEELLTFE